MDLTTAFIRSVGDGKIEIAVNFGPLSGREATLAEVDRLARRLLEVAGDVRVDSIRSHDMGPHHEAIVHQVVATAAAPASAASVLRDIAEAWAAECAAERSLEPLGS